MGKFINPNINLMERINIINPIKAEYIRLGWVYFYIDESGECEDGHCPVR